MARTNVAISQSPVRTHEGSVAQRNSQLGELRRTVMTCMLWEDTLYEKGAGIADRIADLCSRVDPDQVASLAIEARTRMKLRHAPLWMVRHLARRKGNGALVEATLNAVIQRADELAEFVALYWKDKKQPLSAGVKRGLAFAFQKFDAYHLGKYNRDNAVKLRDVLFLCHAKPKDEEQAATWRRLVDGTLESPDTWEVALSAGKDKRETFERLMREKKLGGMATLRNLRNMVQAGVDESLIRERLLAGCGTALPFRFVTAARFAPRLEESIEQSMLKSIEGIDPLPGNTGLLIDVSGSMDYRLGNQNESTSRFMSSLVAKPDETSRIDVASGLAILLREKAESVRVATFSERLVEIPPRRGFALRDAIKNSQEHRGTHLAAAVNRLASEWSGIDRLIVITDEQSQDGSGVGFAPRSYVVNVAPYRYGVGNGNGWHTISGWSERILDYITEHERPEYAA